MFGERIQFETVFRDENLLDEILERNPSLVKLELRRIGSGLLTEKARGATNIFEGLRRRRLRQLDLDRTMSYEMIRARPDLWFAESIIQVADSQNDQEKKKGSKRTRRS